MQKLGEEYYTFVRIKFNLILPRLFFFSQAVGLEPNRLAIYVRPMVVSALLIFNKFFWRYSPEFAGSDLDGFQVWPSYRYRGSLSMERLLPQLFGMEQI
jgi:hypothetical protein